MERDVGDCFSRPRSIPLEVNCVMRLCFVYFTDFCHLHMHHWNSRHCYLAWFEGFFEAFHKILCILLQHVFWLNIGYEIGSCWCLSTSSSTLLDCSVIWIYHKGVIWPFSWERRLIDCFKFFVITAYVVIGNLIIHNFLCTCAQFSICYILPRSLI
jgi:hypothetical protein